MCVNTMLKPRDIRNDRTEVTDTANDLGRDTTPFPNYLEFVIL